VADNNEVVNSKSTEESDRADTDENGKLELKEETVEDLIANWVGSARKMVEGVIQEKDKRLEETLDKYKKNKAEAKVKVDAKYKEVIPKPGRLPPNVFEVFLKKLKTNSESELNRLISELKEKQKTENKELLKSYLSNINDNDKVTDIANKAKEILRRSELQTKQIDRSPVNSCGDSSPRGRNGFKSKLLPSSFSPSIPEIETSAEILKSLNLRIYDEKMIEELKSARITARV
jgi:hypothetical protein